MFDFLVRKTAIKNAQKFIDKLEPKIDVHLTSETPLPSIQALKKICPTVAKIKTLEPAMEKFSDQQLQAKTKEFQALIQEKIKKEKENHLNLQEQYRKAQDHQEREDINIKIEQAHKELQKVKKKTLDEILPEAFAVVREAGKRVLKMRHYDVQMIGGIVLHNGNIAEMTTGEGKTLVATLPAYLNALTNEGVHVVTVNDYLALRDKEWMGPLYEFLGLSIGVIQHDMSPRQRQEAYGCDITYGTNNEFGFDYLRDNMVSFKEEMVQRPHHFAIVDEVDSILVDEARTPLIISGPAEESTDKYYKAYEISKKMKGRRITEKDEVDAKYKEIDLSEGEDYLADEKAKSVSLTEAGEEKAAKLFGVDNLHEMETIEYRHHILQALKAREFFTIDVDYVIRDKQVIIVDEFTGRMMPGRRWSDGLHQAVEAKEGIKIERENQTLATITFQNYFRLYDKLSGMTGTAVTEETEFKQIYDLNCLVIPTNKKLQRINNPDVIYKSFNAKYKAIVSEIEELNKLGRPVLVGTISIEKSELLSRMLTQKGIKHQVLNAKYHDREAHIIAQAGRYQAVTIATNMAGRGTDIVLGGNVEFLAKALVDEKIKNPDDEQERDELSEKFVNQFRQKVKEDQAKVIEAGGLHVIGTERHESRRIDNQLRGRQGRQGDPGSSRFYVSLEDDLMRLFASDRIIGMMDRFGMEEDQVLEAPILSRALENAQKRVEGHNFEIRKHLLEFDDVMNKQREVIYSLRRDILESGDIKNLVLEAIDETVRFSVQQYLFTGGEEEKWDFEGLLVYLKAKFNFDITSLHDKFKDMTQDEINAFLIEHMMKHYQNREDEIGAEQLRYLEKMLFLNTIDAKWKDHLYAMDQLKEGVGLRSYGQRNPLIEYKREGFEMFQMMYSSINQEVAEIIFKIQPVTSPRRPRGVFSALPKKMVHDDFSGMADARRQAGSSPAPSQPSRPDSPSVSPVRSSGPKVGRNDPCPCGSGQKYKKCCGQ